MNEEIIESIKGTKIVLAGEDGQRRQFDISGIFSIDENDLSREFSMQASLFAYFAVLSAKAERNMSIADLASEREYAMADQQIREDLADKDAKVTEALVRQLIAADEEYCTYQDTAQAAKYEYKLLKAIAQALEMRANMLVSLGALRRHEIDMSGMHVNQSKYADGVEDTKETLRRLKSQKEGRQV